MACGCPGSMATRAATRSAPASADPAPRPSGRAPPSPRCRPRVEPSGPLAEGVERRAALDNPLDTGDRQRDAARARLDRDAGRGPLDDPPAHAAAAFEVDLVGPGWRHGENRAEQRPRWLVGSEGASAFPLVLTGSCTRNRIMARSVPGPRARKSFSWRMRPTTVVPVRPRGVTPGEGSRGGMDLPERADQNPSVPKVPNARLVGTLLGVAAIALSALLAAGGAAADGDAVWLGLPGALATAAVLARCRRARAPASRVARRRRGSARALVAARRRGSARGRAGAVGTAARRTRAGRARVRRGGAALAWAVRCSCRSPSACSSRPPAAATCRWDPRATSRTT